MPSFENATSLVTQPLLLVVMGVSGVGKSTIATEVAKRSGFIFLDADDLHSDEAIAQMSQGIPLTDKQREPWIQRIYRQLCDYRSDNANCILAYSGLKQQHREIIFSSYQHRAGVLLTAGEQVINKRLANRREHFMSPQLLSSQIADMEPFDENVPLLVCDVTATVSQLVAEVEGFVRLVQGERAI